MASIFVVYKRCKNCGGTGKVIVDDQYYDDGPPAEVDCSHCNGSGEILWGRMVKEGL